MLKSKEDYAEDALLGDLLDDEDAKKAKVVPFESNVSK